MHRVEISDRRAGGSGNWDARIREQHEEPDRLERYRFAAHVRPGDHHGVPTLADIEIQRHCGMTQQWMPPMHDADQGPVGEVRHAGVSCDRPAGASTNGIQTRHQVAIVVQRVGMLADQRREHLQDPRDFAFLFGAQRTQAVVRLHRRQRLDVHRAARRRLVVHDARELSDELAADRNDVASAAYGDDRFRQHLGEVRFVYDGTAALADLRMERLLLAPDRGQRPRGRIEHLALLVDSSVDRRRHRFAVSTRAGERGERTGGHIRIADRGDRAIERPKRQRDRAQVERRQRRAARGPVGEFAHIARTCETQRSAALQKAHRIVDQVQLLARPAAVPQAWLQPAHGRRSRRTGRLLRYAFDDCRKVERERGGGVDATRSVCHPRRSFKSSRTTSIFALPRLAFMICPTRNSNAFVLPPRYEATDSGLAAMASSTICVTAFASDTCANPRWRMMSCGTPPSATKTSQTSLAALPEISPLFTLAMSCASASGFSLLVANVCSLRSSARRTSPKSQFAACFASAPAATVASKKSASSRVSQSTLASYSLSWCSRTKRSRLSSGSSGSSARQRSISAASNVRGTRSGSGK